MRLVGTPENGEWTPQPATLTSSTVPIPSPHAPRIARRAYLPSSSIAESHCDLSEPVAQTRSILARRCAPSLRAAAPPPAITRRRPNPARDSSPQRIERAYGTATRPPWQARSGPTT